MIRWLKRLRRRVYNWNVRRRNRKRVVGDNKLPANWLAKLKGKKWNRFRRVKPIKTSGQVRLGKARNLPCPCGSGRKFKRCCGK